MPRAEFATFGAERPSRPTVASKSAATPAPPTAAGRSAPSESQRPLNAFLRILLVEESPPTADRISDLLHEVLGDRSARDWVDDPGRAIEIMRSNRHDLYRVADGRPAELAAGVIDARDAPAVGLPAHPADG